jgi:hypothetical protein
LWPFESDELYGAGPNIECVDGIDEGFVYYLNKFIFTHAIGASCIRHSFILVERFSSNRRQWWFKLKQFRH